MIEFARSYKVGDKVFATLEEAQEHELFELLKGESATVHEGDLRVVVAKLREHSAKVIDILSTTANSKPRARRINGGKKNRKLASQPATPPGD